MQSAKMISLRRLKRKERSAMQKKKWCVYSLWKGPRKQKVGKGEYFANEEEARAYLEKRHGAHAWWNRFTYGPCFSNEEKAYDEEDRQIKSYQRSHGGKKPPHNKVGGGGGRRSCKRRK